MAAVDHQVYVSRFGVLKKAKPNVRRLSSLSDDKGKINDEI